MNTELRVYEDQVEMVSKNEIISTAKLFDFMKLYIVFHENALFHGDEEFYVVIFRDFLWVIPDCISGVDELLQAILSKPENLNNIFKARIPPCPFVWRKRILGTIPLFPIPRLAQHPLSTLPDWQQVTRVNREEIKKLINNGDF